MNGYLVDTSILSELAPGRAEKLPPDVASWFIDNGDALSISAMSIAEIAKGVAKLRRGGSLQRAADLAGWLDGIEARFQDRILPFERIAARLAGKMEDDATARGRNPGTPDIIIAATAKAHELTVLTANSRHFEALNVGCHNPLEAG